MEIKQYLNRNHRVHWTYQLSSEVPKDEKIKRQLEVYKEREQDKLPYYFNNALRLTLSVLTYN